MQNLALDTAGVAKSKIRTGTTSEGLKMLSVEIRSEIQKKWESVITPMTGCATYQELRETWKQEKRSKRYHMYSNSIEAKI